MLSRRSRSRSPRDRSESPPPRLPGGAEPITESAYFLKNAEFRVWLKDAKRKYFDELSGEKARKYFRKFVKEWNRGRLSKHLYAGVDPSTQATTAYKWSFASKTKPERDAFARTHDGAAPSAPARVHGPTLPSSADLTLAREAAADQAAGERELQRRHDRRETREREEDAVSPRAVGRERMLEKRAERRAGDRAFRERGDEGFVEADEGTLMGGGSSFQQEIARRDAARRRFQERKNNAREERDASRNERTAAMREKDKATMDMFMQMAKEKFG
ncbi:hypothetical protein K488DRAFT_46823 [Vararia minispora EC-137]|uniref:Uncharacterized protein n=1 Tax=Vararia minispora EC-137 TaxID=1314806 RepID=A0ACB8QQ97_9AGAM|nr:hypothetical protein K488DRAFT_46823 [Vararia minispora EC-137]